MMDKDNRFLHATFTIMEQLLEVDNLNDALAGSLEIIIRELDAEAGAIWLLDKKTDRLTPIFHTGPADITNITVENGIGIEGVVTKSGKSIMVDDPAADARFDGTVFDDYGLETKSMICVPLNNVDEVIGCCQIVNKRSGETFNNDELELVEHMAALAAMTIDEKGFFVELDEQKEVLISLKNVTKDYITGETVNSVLKGINLDIYKNEFVAVLGESGCGKSTMMNIIGGMDSLTEGTVEIEGKDFSHPTDEDLTNYRRNFVGFIFQQYNLMPNLTALENVQFIAELVEDPMPPQEAIDNVGLTSRAGNYPGQMSGGQQQRVSIARAIVKRPRIILADEPTAALDYTTSIEVLKVIEEIMKSKGTTVVMITHNPEIAKMADRVVKIRSGKVASIKKNVHPLHAEELVW